MEASPTTPLARLLAFAGARAPTRGLVRRLSQASRDASVLEQRLLHGRAPSPLVDRGPKREHTPPALVVVTQAAPPAPSVAPAVAPSDEVILTILDAGNRTTCVQATEQHVLHAALEAGANMPFSCALGGCGSCKVRLVSGDYEMDEPNCLTDEERAAGFVLTCVGRAKSACTLEIIR